MFEVLVHAVRVDSFWQNCCQNVNKVWWSNVKSDVKAAFLVSLICLEVCQLLFLENSETCVINQQQLKGDTFRQESINTLSSLLFLFRHSPPNVHETTFHEQQQLLLERWTSHSSAPFSLRLPFYIRFRFLSLPTMEICKEKVSPGQTLLTMFFLE